MNLLALAVATATTVSSSTWIDDLSDSVSGRVRAASGGEWDTNAFRAVDGNDVARQGAKQTSDGLMRFLLSAKGNLPIGDNHSVSASYLLGAKQFFDEQSQDLAAHQLVLASRHRLSPSLNLGTNARYRASRIRDGSRNYDLGTGGLRLGWFPAAKWNVSSDLSFVAYRFFAQPRFDYLAPLASLSVGFSPWRRLWLSVRGNYQYRHYFSNGLVATTALDNEGNPSGEPYASFCDPPLPGESCTPTPRRDHEGQLAFGVAWRGSFLLGADYLLRLQRSTSDFENTNRHRISVYGTFAFPWRLTASIVGALQFNDGLSVTDNAFLAEDDESQNSLILKLRQGLTDELALELRYSLFANQFSTADVSFLRQTIYLGVSFATDI